MDLAQKIKLLRSEKGWTQEELAKKSGVSIQSIKRYETGIGENITTSNLEKIAKVFDVKKSYFLNDDEGSLVVRKSNGNLVRKSFVSHENLSPSASNLKKSDKSYENEEENEIIAIPYFEDTYASAGDGVIDYDESPITLDFNEGFLRGFLGIKGDLSCIHIINARGDSMQPTIDNGELLFVSAISGGNGIISGYVYVVNYSGDIYVKRLERDPTTGAITLVSDNQNYRPIIIEGENLENCNIIGRVVAHIRKGTI
ncbi:LexA family transcriptional regulator [uncultured Campylobacter sp.]|uniref:XRE family transcriptional regulator n=1 Tax=uncultured Campylobacter sp. TaxID=218934 RepID=UPI0026349977|nr:LexA family transcriptional regulator [uncultured Campylobacter sp.]